MTLCNVCRYNFSRCPAKSVAAANFQPPSQAFQVCSEICVGAFACASVCVHLHIQYAHIHKHTDGLEWTNFHFLPTGGNSGGGKKSSKRRRATRRSTNSTGAKPGTQEALCSKIKSSDSNLATTWASIVLAVGTAMFTRLSLRTHALWSNRADIMEGRSISFSEWFGTSWCATTDAVAGAGSFFLSYEMPVLEKGFLGFTDSSAQAWVSGCVEYQVGGAITILFVFFATVAAAYWMYTSQKKHLTYIKNPHHQDWLDRLFGRPPIILDPMPVESSVPG